MEDIDFVIAYIKGNLEAFIEYYGEDDEYSAVPCLEALEAAKRVKKQLKSTVKSAN